MDTLYTVDFLTYANKQRNLSNDEGHRSHRTTSRITSRTWIFINDHACGKL